MVDITVFKGNWNMAESTQWTWRYEEEAGVDPAKVLEPREKFMPGGNGSPHWKCLYQTDTYHSPQKREISLGGKRKNGFFIGKEHDLSMRSH